MGYTLNSIIDRMNRIISFFLGHFMVSFLQQKKINVSSKV
jgi:hypothetical protein